MSVLTDLIYGGSNAVAGLTEGAVNDAIAKYGADKEIAEMVHEMLREEHPDISLATIYRNLALFKSQGLIQSVGTVNGSERFDADTRPHVHFICTTCGAVIDLPQTAAPLSLGRAAEECTGCQVHSCQLTFTGLCRGCQSQTKEEAV